ncbi:MAG: sigma-70 family RNA polymerase sigma factor [Planctomycetes bacterium]|nr:sigma-70 family RNA polymerase sigma factor [Planctomycetota bacterium]
MRAHRLRGVDFEDLVQDTVVRLLEIEKRLSLVRQPIGLALAVASRVWKEALRRTEREPEVGRGNAHVEDLCEDRPMELSEAHYLVCREDLRAWLLACTGLNGADADLALDIYVDGLSTREAGVRRGVEFERALACRQRIRREFLRLLMQPALLQSLRY